MWPQKLCCCCCSTSCRIIQKHPCRNIKYVKILQWWSNMLGVCNQEKNSVPRSSSHFVYEYVHVYDCIDVSDILRYNCYWSTLWKDARFHRVRVRVSRLRNFFSLSLSVSPFRGCNVYVWHIKQQHCTSERAQILNNAKCKYPSQYSQSSKVAPLANKCCWNKYNRTWRI